MISQLRGMSVVVDLLYHLCLGIPIDCIITPLLFFVTTGAYMY